MSWVLWEQIIGLMTWAGVMGRWTLSAPRRSVVYAGAVAASPTPAEAEPVAATTRRQGAG